MIEFQETPEHELLAMAESWLNAELRKIPTKLGLTPTQMMRVVFRCTSRFVEQYLKTIKDDDDVSETGPSKDQ